MLSGFCLFLLLTSRIVSASTKSGFSSANTSQKSSSKKMTGKGTEAHPIPLRVYDSGHGHLPGPPSAKLTPFEFDSTSASFGPGEDLKTVQICGDLSEEADRESALRITSNAKLLLTKFYDSFGVTEKVLLLAKVCIGEMAELSARKAAHLYSTAFHTEGTDPEKFAADILSLNEIGTSAASILVAVLYGNKGVFDALVRSLSDDSFRALALRSLFLFRTPRVTFQEFLTGFGPESVFEFSDFLRNIADMQYFEHLETHFRIQQAFLLIRHSHETFALALNERLLYQRSCASVLFHALCRSADYSDADLSSLIEPFLKNKQFESTDLLSMLISASHFRPKLVPILFHHCLTRKPLSTVVPQLSFKHPEVVAFISSRIREYKESELEDMVTFAHTNRLPCSHLIYFLSLKMKIEDYLIKLIRENRSYLVTGQMDLISRIDLAYMEAQLAIHLQSIDFDEIRPILMTCAESPIIYELPIQMLPRALSEKLQIKPEERDRLAQAQNDIVYHALCALQSRSIEPRTVHNILVNLISYSSNPAELFEFMISQKDLEGAAKLALVVAVESTMQTLSFESAQKRVVKVVQDAEVGDYLRITSQNGEEHFVMI